MDGKQAAELEVKIMRIVLDECDNDGDVMTFLMLLMIHMMEIKLKADDESATIKDAIDFSIEKLLEARKQV